MKFQVLIKMAAVMSLPFLMFALFQNATPVKQHRLSCKAPARSISSVELQKDRAFIGCSTAENNAVHGSGPGARNGRF